MAVSLSMTSRLGVFPGEQPGDKAASLLGGGHLDPISHHQLGILLPETPPAPALQLPGLLGANLVKAPLGTEDQPLHSLLFLLFQSVPPYSALLRTKPVWARSISRAWSRIRWEKKPMASSGDRKSVV